MRKFYSGLLVVAFTVLSSICFGQISVTATAGTTGPTTYTTLKGAFDAINAGTHQGSITINVTGNTTETASAVLNASGTGAASYTAVLIQPTATATISGNIAGPLIDLNGADNVTIDGRINSTGTTRSLTLSNTSTSNAAGTSTTRMINSAQNNTLNYLIIEGSSTLNADATATVLIDSSLTGGGNMNITISNNDIGAAGGNTPALAIYSVGESGTLANSNITVSNNLIHDYFNPAGVSAGILADIFSTAWTITGNSIYQTAARTSTANILHAGIFINAGEGHHIENNFIGGGAPNAGGTATTISGAFSNRYFGILVDVGTATPTSIDGNTITNLNLSSTPAANANVFTGIQVDGGNVNIGVTTGNTIGSQTTTGAITLNISGASTNFNDGIISFSTGTLVVRNNSIGSITASGTATGTVVLRGIEAYSATSFTAENNLVGGTVAGSIQASPASSQMGGIFAYPNASNASVTVNNNTIRNLTNNGTGVALITGVNTQMNASSITGVAVNITNNTISDLNSPGTGAALGSIAGVSIGVGSTTNTSANMNINGNTIFNLSAGSTDANFAVRGIQNSAGYANFLNINGNTIHSLTSAAPNVAATSATGVQGISSSTSSAGAVSVSENTIYNLESTASAAVYVVGVGLFHGSTTNSSTVTKNNIYDLRAPNSTGQISGLVLRGNAGNGTFHVNNNMISLSPANAQVYGIHNNAAASAVNAIYNSVYIGGTASGTNMSAAFFRNGATVGSAVDLRNNILYNTRTGGGSHYAVANNHGTPATGWGPSAFNNLYTSNAATAALWGAASQTLANYSTSASDGSSNAVTVSFVDAATGDLHLTGASVSDAALNGTPIASITTDFDGDTRDATAPKKGADEVSGPPCDITITTQPTAQAACTGDNITFTVAATTGSGTLTYQWRRNGANIAGATSASYTVAASAATAGNYDVVVSNGTCSVTSTQAALTENTAPAITTHPTSITVCQGNASFSVTATGTGLTYQWQVNGTPVPGATAATASVPIASIPNGAYTVNVVVTNACGSTTSNNATLTVSTPCTSVPNVNEEVSSMLMMPNVVRDMATLRVNVLRTMKMNFNVVDAQGRVVMTLSRQVLAGQNDISLYLGQLSAGTYQLQGATDKGASTTIRFVKQ